MIDEAPTQTDDEPPAGQSETAVPRSGDPRIAERIEAALGSAVTVLNVGAGGGAYEPAGREVVAVEPDQEMRAQRPQGSAPVIDARAEKLPFEDDSFDAAMACMTVHRWSDPEAGLNEMRRVTRGPVVVLTLDLPRHIAWQRDYLKPLFTAQAGRFPSPVEIATMLGPRAKVQALRTPIDCSGDFLDAYWGRPEALLDPEVRRAQPAWELISEVEHDEVTERLRADLDSGAWDSEHGHLRRRPDYDGALRIVVDDPTAALSMPRRI